MTNKEVFEQYNTEQWVIEQDLCYLLQLYWEKIQPDIKNGWDSLSMPENPVGFVKSFMQDQTLCELTYAEKSKLSTLEKNVIEVLDV